MKLSIIIPVYNAGQYLRRCLDSILTDNDTDGIEVICVNDGSTDDSLRILHEYADKFTFMMIADQSNSGVSAARNRGLQMAQGEYIMFVDADDYISPGTIQNFLAETEKSGCDMSIASMVRVGRSGEVSAGRLKNKKYEDADLWLLMKELGTLELGAPWMKLFKRSIINEHNIRFNTSMAMFEDVAFVLSYLPYCSKVITSDIVLYHYMANGLSATSKYHGEDFFTCLSIYRKVQINCLNWLNAPQGELKTMLAEIDRTTAYHMIFAIYTIYRAVNRPKNKYRTLKRYLSEGQHIGLYWGGKKGRAGSGCPGFWSSSSPGSLPVDYYILNGEVG